MSNITNKESVNEYKNNLINILTQWLCENSKLEYTRGYNAAVKDIINLIKGGDLDDLLHRMSSE